MVAKTLSRAKRVLLALMLVVVLSGPAVAGPVQAGICPDPSIPTCGG